MLIKHLETPLFVSRISIVGFREGRISIANGLESPSQEEGRQPSSFLDLGLEALTWTRGAFSLLDFPSWQMTWIALEERKPYFIIIDR